MKYSADTWFLYKLSEGDKKAEKIWNNVVAGKDTLLIPAIVLTEIKRFCIRNAKLAVYEDFKNDFLEAPSINIQEIDHIIADLAGSISADYNVPTIDALIVACALDKKCNVILSNDGYIKKIKRPLKIKVSGW